MSTRHSAAKRPFLTARWRNLILANYSVPAALLEPYLPPGIELDSWDNQHWASLVAFEFLETRVLGVSWPGFRNFPEWNLRFYVRRRTEAGTERGVCFVREFVPQWFVATSARLIYNEPYRVARLSAEIQNLQKETGAQIVASYGVEYRKTSHRLSVTAQAAALLPHEDSVEHFFKEHAWGFGTSRRGKLIRYEVNHPRWEVHPVLSHEIKVDWGALYGPEWAVMNGQSPGSVILAAGSAVSVYPLGTS